MIRNWLPRWLSSPLWGDRHRWGLRVDEHDACWKEWQNSYLDFYAANQRKGIGTIVNDAGYQVMSSIDLSGKRVLEIGPGDIRHNVFWNGLPAEYLVADIQVGMLQKAEAKLDELHVKHSSLLLQRGAALPLDDEVVDIVISFYSLEHIYPLNPYLEELKRVMRSGGILIGAIPAEGGLPWGLGRALTSRRWFQRHTNIDPDKIICWEHPNYADQVVDELESCFGKGETRFWPASAIPVLDANLLLKFIYTKEGG
jgi:SAM-dependent methyltransferase